MSIIIENSAFRLELTEECITKSLICKATGEECLEQDKNIPLFSLTEDRPFNNEIKLAHPNKRTIFNANRVRREENKLIVGFELITFEAVIEVTEASDYISFTLSDFIIKPEDFEGLKMTPPPVAEFRLIQLPIKNRLNFGEWLNVMWDEKTAVNVLANSPYARIDSEKRDGFRIMTADAVKGIKLKGCSATLIASASDNLLNVIESVENDYNLPKGVASRRCDKINASAYWTDNATPLSIDKHIEYAKSAGFSMMLLYYTCCFKEDHPYKRCNEFDWRDEYPNKIDDLKEMLKKIKDAGITPGLHILHTHIGRLTAYVTPVADHRLNLTRHFTLSKALGIDDTEIFVEENPEGSVTHEDCRVLKFGGELIYYQDYSTEYPYRFTGCKRGHWNTNVITHELGQIGGILDVSEYGAGSIYLNQESSLQDEIADKLAEIYNAGFEYIYFDGSEGTNPPFEFHVSNAQYRVYKKAEKAPLYCEGAAKSHFGWHMISGGNAFDAFPMPIFKEKIAEHPFAEAPEMQKDFTRVNFGWWSYAENTMPDIYEYGTSKAASYNCPVTMQSNPKKFESNPRTSDNFEVIRRWEDVRAKKWLTDEQKLMLRDPNKEFILLINENGNYELIEYSRINLPENICEDITAYTFNRQDKTYIVLWHTKGDALLRLPFDSEYSYTSQLGGEEITVSRDGKYILLPVAGRRYFSSDVAKDTIIKAFCSATLEDK